MPGQTTLRATSGALFSARPTARVRVSVPHVAITGRRAGRVASGCLRQAGHD